MRYKYIALKYTRTGPDTAFHTWGPFGSWSHPSSMVWRPSTDVYETREKLVVIVEIAGVAEEDLTVTLFSDLLVVEGIRQQNAVTAMNACHQLGIKYGEFRSEVHVPFPVDTDSVNAEFRNGLLTVTLNKSA